MVGPPFRSAQAPMGVPVSIITTPNRDRMSEAPPEAWDPLLRAARFARRPLERFLRVEAASGILLLVAAAIALAWANSPWAGAYSSLWHTPLGVRIGAFAFERSLEWFVNDVLMVIFFFVVGLEIRREIHVGELSELRRAALPAAAALGGMLAPAAFYLLIAGASATRSGWGVPMATDIAFAVGILALLGKRVPPALRVLLLALAVIDDLGAIVVIALFYSSGIALSGCALAALGLAAVFLMQRLGVRAKPAYVVRCRCLGRCLQRGNSSDDRRCHRRFDYARPRLARAGWLCGHHAHRARALDGDFGARRLVTRACACAAKCQHGPARGDVTCGEPD